MTIVCYGDSNTWGYDPREFFGCAYDRSWPEILAGISGYYVQNEGSNGRQIPKCQYCPPKNTDLLAVMLGTNDLLQGETPQNIVFEMEHFLKSIPLSFDKILLIAPPPMKLGAWVDRQELILDSIRLAEGYRCLCTRLGVHFADAGQWNVPLAFDGVHFTEEGHRIFAESLYRYLCNNMR